MSKSQLERLLIILVMILVGAIVIFFLEPPKEKYIKRDKVKENTLLKKNDSIDSSVIKREQRIQILRDSIKTIEKQSKIIEIRYEKDIHGIDSNTLQQDIEFFTKYLSTSKNL